MKRILLTLFSIACISAAGFAQTTKAKVNSKTSSTTVVGDKTVTIKTHAISNPGISKTTTTVSTRPVRNTTMVVTKKGKLDKRYKVNRNKKRNGAPDMRYKQNKKYK